MIKFKFINHDYPCPHEQILGSLPIILTKTQHVFVTVLEEEEKEVCDRFLDCHDCLDYFNNIKTHIKLLKKRDELL